MATTDPDMWKCPKCGLRLRDCRCSYRRRGASVLLATGFALALLVSPLQAECGCEIVPEPVVPIVGPCHSDTTWGCYEYQQHLPMLIYDNAIVGDDATPEPAIVTPTPTPTPTPTATATPVPAVTATLVLVTVTP